MELLPFGSVDRCPKCGNTTRTRKYKGQYQTFGSARDEITRFDEGLPEHLDVSCVACGYGWWEQCADAGEKARTDPGATQKFNAA
jgi:predicted nucleic-acid-binding Zn-ribbon protein